MSFKVSPKAYVPLTRTANGEYDQAVRAASQSGSWVEWFLGDEASDDEIRTTKNGIRSRAKSLCDLGVDFAEITTVAWDDGDEADVLPFRLRPLRDIGRRVQKLK